MKILGMVKKRLHLRLANSPVPTQHSPYSSLSSLLFSISLPPLFIFLSLRKIMLGWFVESVSASSELGLFCYLKFNIQVPYLYEPMLFFLLLIPTGANALVHRDHQHPFTS